METLILSGPIYTTAINGKVLLHLWLLFTRDPESTDVLKLSSTVKMF